MRLRTSLSLGLAATVATATATATITTAATATAATAATAVTAATATAITAATTTATATTATATATTVTPLLPAGAAHAVAEAACAAADARAFPLATRIRGGPGSYEAGGGYGTWYIDLTNTTRTTCTGIHPVVVLVDDKRALRAGQPQLDFYDGPRARPVTFETTDEQELVGVLDGSGFAGFTVPPGKTVSVRVRLALTSDAVPDHVTVNVAAVQRRGGDGEWAGESNAYRFAIAGEEDTQDPPNAQDTEDTEDNGGTEDTRQDAQDAQEAQDGQATGDGQGTNDPPDPRVPHDPHASPAPRGTADTPGPRTPEDAQEAAGVPSAPGSAVPTGTGVPDSSLSLASKARELARTGPGLALGLLVAVGALCTVGAGAFLLARRRR
ncbi:hypothetical protein AB0F36_04040 [Streptomyces sp. NPDC029080]|uniref:hypothetical protein n=1 Tax=Streptomyces sp. NPDC029080 TaxID=3155017 RepID=UPI0033FD97D6